jgi:hypothetical protein
MRNQTSLPVKHLRATIQVAAYPLWRTIFYTAESFPMAVNPFVQVIQEVCWGSEMRRLTA